MTGEGPCHFPRTASRERAVWNREGLFPVYVFITFSNAVLNFPMSSREPTVTRT
jgi:hypothetical protein